MNIGCKETELSGKVEADKGTLPQLNITVLDNWRIFLLSE